MEVTTNNIDGYTVTVQALAPQLTATQPNIDTIPIQNLHVRETGTTTTYHPLSNTNPVLVHTQTGPSAAAGDVISNDYQVDIPFVESDAYTVSLEYIAMTQ